MNKKHFKGGYKAVYQHRDTTTRYVDYITTESEHAARKYAREQEVRYKHVMTRFERVPAQEIDMDIETTIVNLEGKQ